MKYEILSASEMTTLVDAVNERIALGWKPLGGVSVAVWPELRCDAHGATWTESSFVITQAVVFEPPQAVFVAPTLTEEERQAIMDAGHWTPNVPRG